MKVSESAFSVHLYLNVPIKSFESPALRRRIEFLITQELSRQLMVEVVMRPRE